MNEFFYGCFGGMIGTIISHPIDTIRVNIQSSNIPKYSVKYLFNGIQAPLIGIGLEKAVVFGSYNIINNFMKQNYYTRDISSRYVSLYHFIAGVGSGFASTFIVTPVEYLKINYQNNSRIHFRNITYKNMYRGWTATLFREVPGYGIYFYTYNKCILYFGKNPYSIFMSGGLAGVTAWIGIYPADYVKTRMQFYQTSFRYTLKEILKDKGILGMYNGCSLALARAFILHCGVFSAYEYIKHYS